MSLGVTACQNMQCVECLPYIFETSASLNTGKDKFTRPSLIIKLAGP